MTAIVTNEYIAVQSPVAYTAVATTAETAFHLPTNAVTVIPAAGNPDMIKVQTDAELKRYQIEQETQLKREQLAAEMTLKREQMAMEMQLKQSVVGGAGMPSLGRTQLGGDPG